VRLAVIDARAPVVRVGCGQANHGGLSRIPGSMDAQAGSLAGAVRLRGEDR
jgi:hypothetical protein